MTAPEVLTVIAVLGILAALAISGTALRDRRAEARSGRCLNQLRQLSQALFLYANDHRNMLPPLHDGPGLAALQDQNYIPVLPRQKYLYYGGLLQIEFQKDMGMLRDENRAHPRGGNTAFGDGHAETFKNLPGKPWEQTALFFQMDHRQDSSRIRKLNRTIPWSNTWTAQ